MLGVLLGICLTAASRSQRSLIANLSGMLAGTHCVDLLWRLPDNSAIGCAGKGKGAVLARGPLCFSGASMKGLPKGPPGWMGGGVETVEGLNGA